MGVDGSESQDEGSPSYYNVEEAVEVARQVRDLCGEILGYQRGGDERRWLRYVRGHMLEGTF